MVSDIVNFSSFALIILICGWNLFFSSGWHFSRRLFTIWTLVFIVVYPVLASISQQFISFSQGEVVYGFSCWLLFVSFFYFSYGITAPSFPVKPILINIKFRTILLISVTTILLLVNINGLDWTKLFVRAGMDSTFEAEEYSPFSMIVKNYVRAFAHFCMFFWFISDKNTNIWRRVLITVLLLVVSFPLSLPRIQVAILYAPIVFYLFHRFFNKKFVIETFVAFSLGTVFVVLDFFRKYDDYLEHFDYMQYLMSGHFDAFENFLYLLRTDYVSYGSQLIGALGFFIPRVFWPTKPIGSGAHTAMLQDLPADNIAMPLAGEGFINFGIFGVALFAIVAGIISKRIDSFSVSPRLTLNTKYYFIFKVTFAMLFFFILRGDLMSGLSFAVATLGALSTIAFLFSARQSSPVLNDDQIFNRSDF